MSNQLLFVQVPGNKSSETQTQKELKYAASKAHAARNAHLRRRREVEQSSDYGVVGYGSSGQGRAGSPVHMLPGPDGNISYPWDSHLTKTTAPLLNQTVSFVRFYMSRCWSPSFMIRLVERGNQCCPVLGSGSAIGLIGARWLWDVFNADTGAFLSALASVVPVMKRFVSETYGKQLDEVALQLRTRSIQRLRADLQTQGAVTRPTMALVYQIKALFREACMAGNIKVARTHARMLNWLAQTLPTTRDDIHLLRLALWSDAVPALLQLRRPIPEQSTWMPQQLNTIWQSAESVLPSLQLVRTDLLECIVSPELRAAFLHVRQALYVGSVSMVAEQYEQMKRAEMIFQWMTSKAEYHMCSLLNLYFALLEPAPAEYAMTEGQRCSEAALALALLHILQKSFTDMTQDNGVDLHESAAAIHQPLACMMQNAMTVCSSYEKHSYRAAHFWTVFVGAYCEERLQSFNKLEHQAPGVDELSPTWFHQELREQAIPLGLSGWIDAKPVVEQCVFNQSLYPHPDRWYEQTIRG